MKKCMFVKVRCDCMKWSVRAVLPGQSSLAHTHTHIQTHMDINTRTDSTFFFLFVQWPITSKFILFNFMVEIKRVHLIEVNYRNFVFSDSKVQWKTPYSFKNLQMGMITAKIISKIPLKTTNISLTES